MPAERIVRNLDQFHAVKAGDGRSFGSVSYTHLDVYKRQPELWTSYIAVEKPVLWSASQVHGITTEMLADAPSFPSLWPELRSRLGQSVVVGHNPATERKFLRRFPGHGFGPWMDTLALGRMCVPGLADYSLSSLCGALGPVSYTHLDVYKRQSWTRPCCVPAASTGRWW